MEAKGIFVGEGKSRQLKFDNITTYDANIRRNLVTVENLMIPGVTPHEDFCHPDFDVRAGGLSLHRDGFHLSLDYGRYLAALVWLKYFTGVSPDRVTFTPEGCEPRLIAKIKQFV